MTRIYSFPPITAPGMRVLILGSIPGAMSLRMEQYYAHRQNAFWKILGELIGAGRELDYADRVARLQSHDIGLWDVLMSCHRPGSLDSAIDHATIQPNDLAGLYAAHPELTHVFFNGAKAEETYRRYVLPGLAVSHSHLRYERLPSTSPTHAAMSYPEKLSAWRRILI